MVNILISSVKGGVGKSTVSSELVSSLKRTDEKFSYIDLDYQGDPMYETSIRDDAVVTVIDTPPGMSENLGKWQKSADVLVIPTLMTARDMIPLQKMRDIVKANFKGPVLYVLNRWDRFNASKDFVTWFNQLPDTDNRVLLPQSTVFARASEYQESVVTFAKRSPAAIAVMEMVNKVRRMAGLPEESIL